MALLSILFSSNLFQVYLLNNQSLPVVIDVPILLIYLFIFDNFLFMSTEKNLFDRTKDFLSLYI